MRSEGIDNLLSPEIFGVNPRKDQETYAIIGAAIEVHRELGQGFLEIVYQEALAVEFDEQCIPFSREVPLPIQY